MESVIREDPYRPISHCAWNANLQLSKMLGDSSFPQFLPSVFALVSGVLDSFGEVKCQPP